MIVPWGAVIVTLWGFLTTSHVGIAIFLTEVVIGVVSKVIEITTIRRIVSSIRVVITTRVLVVTIIPRGIIAVTTECVSTIIPVGGYRDARHSDVDCRRYDDCRSDVDCCHCGDHRCVDVRRYRDGCCYAAPPRMKGPYYGYPLGG